MHTSIVHSSHTIQDTIHNKSSPEGFNMVRCVYENVQESFLMPPQWLGLRQEIIWVQTHWLPYWGIRVPLVGNKEILPTTHQRGDLNQQPQIPTHFQILGMLKVSPPNCSFSDLLYYIIIQISLFALECVSFKILFEDGKYRL